jgi:hypothetical protein
LRRSDEWSSSKLATCMSYSLYFGCTVSKVGYTLEEKWLLAKSCVWSAFNFNYKYIFLLCIS